MRARILIVCLQLIAAVSYAQNSFTYTGTGPRNWNETTLWSLGFAPSTTAQDGTVQKTVEVTDTRSAGNVTIAGADLLVRSTSTFTLGSSTLFPGTKKNLVFSNNNLLDVAGNLYVYGDLDASNGLTLTVTGKIIVYGNIILGNGGDLIVSGTGSLEVKGSISGGNDTDITTTGGGTIAVTGSITTGGGGSSISGPAGSITASSCSVGGAACGTAVTPVELIFFKSVRSANAVELIWATESELNFDYFIVEHSTDGISFSSIGQLQGHGTTNIRHDYQFIDDLPFIGKNYYRLKSVDFDGYTEYFDILLVSFDGDKQFQLSPNPSDGLNIKAKTNFMAAEKGSVIVYDNVGSVVGRFELEGNESEFNFSDKLKAGIYFAKFSTDGFTKVARFLVRE